MKNIFKSKNSESGQVVLFVVFIILFFMLFIGLFISRMILGQVKIANNVLDSTQAYYIADSGTEATLYMLKSGYYAGPFNEGDAMPEDNLFSSIGGSYDSVVIERVPGTEILRLKITGFYKKTSRNIEISW